MSTEEQLSIHEGRFTAIEKNHLQLQKDVASLAKETSALAAAIQGITNSITGIASTQNANLKTNWSVVFAGLSVVVLVVGLVIYGPLSTLIEGHKDHIDDGHPQSVLSRSELIVSAFNARMDRRQTEDDKTRQLLDETILSLAEFRAGASERILDIEREIYAGSIYRSGRPIPLEPKPQALIEQGMAGHGR